MAFLSRAALVVVTALPGCNVLFEIERVSLAETEVSGCTLPAEGDARFRLAQLVPEAGRIDLCYAPAGRRAVGPLLARGGADCPDGFSYKDVTRTVGLPPGEYDVWAVEAGASCSSSERARVVVTLEANRVVTLALIGNTQAEARLVALPETPPAVNAGLVRIVHALPTPEDSQLMGGVAEEPQLPTTIIAPVFQDLRFGGVARAGTSGGFEVDANGYADMGPRVVNPSLAVAYANDPAAIALAKLDLAPNRVITLFAVGNDAEYRRELWACLERDPDTGILLECGQPVNITVEVFGALLADWFEIEASARIAAVEALVRDSEVDFLCLSDVYPPAVVDGLVAAAAPHFPHVVRSDSPTLQVGGDLTDRSGVVPTPPTVPCSPESLEPAGELLECLRRTCTSTTDPEHLARYGPDCLGGTACIEQSYQLGYDRVEGGAECWGCLVPMLAEGRGLSEVESVCLAASNPDDRWVHGRSPGVIVFAKHPPVTEDQPELWRLPSAYWQKGVLRYPAELPNGAQLDFYCTHFTHQEAVDNPYVGPYGEGQTGPEGGAVEQRLQAERLLAFVRDRSDRVSRRAIIAAQLFSGPEATARDVEAFRLETYATLVPALLPLVPNGEALGCTRCDANPLVGGKGAGGFWFSHLLGLGIDPRSIVRAELVHQELVANGEAGRIPASKDYGLRSFLKISQ